MAGWQTDITEGKVSDPLTGLPNRLLFPDRLSRLMRHPSGSEGYLFAVLFLDLDGFKMSTIALGHLVGDQFLVGVASRLEKCLRATDMVARVDERISLLPAWEEMNSPFCLTT